MNDSTAAFMALSCASIIAGEWGYFWGPWAALVGAGIGSLFFLCLGERLRL